jgi:hypothetical protein
VLYCIISKFGLEDSGMNAVEGMHCKTSETWVTNIFDNLMKGMFQFMFDKDGNHLVKPYGEACWKKMTVASCSADKEVPKYYVSVVCFFVCFLYLLAIMVIVCIQRLMCVHSVGTMWGMIQFLFVTLIVVHWKL